MVNLDLVPRICMSLMLTVGGILSEFKGVPHPTWQMVGIVLLGPVWLAMVLTVHLQEGSELGKTIAKIDYWFRVLLVIYLLISVTVSFQFGSLGDEHVSRLLSDLAAQFLSEGDHGGRRRLAIGVLAPADDRTRGPRAVDDE